MIEREGGRGTGDDDRFNKHNIERQQEEAAEQKRIEAMVEAARKNINRLINIKKLKKNK